jgi:hypothetical protein
MPNGVELDGLTERAYWDREELQWAQRDIETIFVLQRRRDTQVTQPLDDWDPKIEGELGFDEPLGMSQKERDREIRVLEAKAANFKRASVVRDWF